MQSRWWPCDPANTYGMSSDPTNQASSKPALLGRSGSKDTRALVQVSPAQVKVH